MFKKNKNGFTLIELLAVCTIIAVLAVVATISYKNAKIQSRDAKRKSDMNTIVKAFQLYYDKNGTYRVDGTGCSGNGNGWFNYVNSSDNYPKSINQGLIDASFLSGTIKDPSGSVGSGDQPGYMFYYNDDACSYAHLENSSTDDQATMSNCGSGYPNPYGMNYAIRITP